MLVVDVCVGACVCLCVVVVVMFGACVFGEWAGCGVLPLCEFVTHSKGRQMGRATSAWAARSARSGSRRRWTGGFRLGSEASTNGMSSTRRTGHFGLLAKRVQLTRGNRRDRGVARAFCLGALLKGYVVRWQVGKCASQALVLCGEIQARLLAPGWTQSTENGAGEPNESTTDSARGNVFG